MFGLVALVVVLAALAITASSAGADAFLVGQWHFDEGSGTVAADSSGYDNNGQLIAESGSALPGRVTGRFGTALSFNAHNGVEVFSPSSSIQPGNVSVGAWVKNSGSPGDYRYIVAKGATGCVSASYGLYTGPHGGLAFYVSHSNTQAGYVLSPEASTRVWNGNWHLVAGSFDGGTLRLWVDGVEVGSGTQFSGQIAYAPTNSNDLFIGDYPQQATPCQASGFSGAIDEVTVWNGALTAAQVAALQPAGGTTSPEGSTSPGGSTGSGPGSTGSGTGSTSPVGGPPLGNPSQGPNRGKLPALSRLSVSPSSVATPSSAHHPKHTSPPKISYTDTQAAFSTLSVWRGQPGIVQRGRCITAPKGKLAKNTRRCTHYVMLGHFTHADRAGANQFAFSFLSHLKLAPRLYWLEATPSTHGMTGRTVVTTFTIKR
jgi:hypothetical protein